MAPGAVGKKMVVSQHGQDVETVYVVQEADQSRTSHRWDGTANPDYDQSLQPRDRSLPQYRSQTQKIAQDLDNPKFDMLSGDRVDEGTPIMDDRGDTITGNGRENAIVMAYEQGYPSASAYRDALIARAKEFGIYDETVKAMKQPVLKRVIVTPMTKGELVKFSQESNEPKAMASNAMEMAGQDASRITPQILSGFDPNYDLDSAKNAQFLNDYTQSVILGRTKPGERANEANMTRSDLARRVRMGIFAYAYGMNSTGRAAIERLAGDESDSGGKTITNALLTVAPIVARMKTDITSGDVHNLDISPEIARAAQDISEALRNKPSKQTPDAALSGLLNQGEFNIDPLEREIMDFLINNRTSRVAIEEGLSNYVESVFQLGNPKQSDLFGAREIPSQLELFRKATSPGALLKSQSTQGSSDMSAQDRAMALMVRNGKEPQDVARDYGVALSHVERVYDKLVGSFQPHPLLRSQQTTVQQMPSKFALSKPVKGPSGAELVGYEWRSTMGEKWSEREGGYVDARVSDWENKENSHPTGRDIVHVYWVKGKDGEIKPHGINAASSALGFQNETRLQKAAKDARAEQTHRANQSKLEAKSLEKAAVENPADANRNYRQWNSSHLRSFEEDDQIFRDARLFEKDGKFIRSGLHPDRAEILRDAGWKLVASDKYASPDVPEWEGERYNPDGKGEIPAPQISPTTDAGSELDLDNRSGMADGQSQETPVPTPADSMHPDARQPEFQEETTPAFETGQQGDGSQNVGAATKEEWQEDPRSTKLPAQLSYVDDFDKTDFSKPLEVARIDKLPWEKKNYIAEAYGWRIHKNNAAEELAGRKKLLDLGREGDFELTVAAMPNKELKALAEGAGLSMKYGDREVRNRIVTSWIDNSERKLREWTGMASWMLHAVDDMKAGKPLDSGMATSAGIHNIARSQYGYEENGGRLEKGDSARWTVDGRTYSKSELEKRVESSTDERAKFLEVSKGLKDELGQLLAENSGETVDRKKMDTFQQSPRYIEQLKADIENSRSEESRKVKEQALATLEQDYQRAKDAIQPTVDRIGEEKAERLAFLGSGVIEKRVGLLEKIDKNIARLKEKFAGEPDAVSEVKPVREPSGGQLSLFSQAFNKDSQKPVDDEEGAPVVFKREREPASTEEGTASGHTGAAVAGGAQRSISRRIEAAVTRGSAETGHEFPKGSVSRWAAETKSVGEIARDPANVIQQADIDRLPLHSENTVEHKVHYDAATHRAVKVTEPGNYGITAVVNGTKETYTPGSPVDYARRWELFNQVFNDDVRIEGFTTSNERDPFTKEPRYGIVISQPWRTAVDLDKASPEPDEVNSYMDSLGFLPGIHGQQWYRPGDGIYVADARPDNFIKTAQGVHPIDLVVDQLSQDELKMLGLKNAQDAVDEPSDSDEKPAGTNELTSQPGESTQSGMPQDDAAARAEDNPSSVESSRTGNDYRLKHRPDPKGAPVHSLPADVYAHPDSYAGDLDSEESRESLQALKSARGKSDGEVTIYRSGPSGKFNEGDWVSLSKTYAQKSGMHATDETKDEPVYSVKVPASDVRWPGDDINEFGYFGKPIDADPENRAPENGALSSQSLTEEKKASTQFNIPADQQKPIRDFANSIPDNEIYYGEEGADDEGLEYGRETKPHVTALYGLHPDTTAEDVAGAVDGLGPAKFTLGKLSKFSNDKYDVLKADVHGDDLHKYNSALRTLPYESDYPDYQPHMTIAYLKKGEADKYVGDDRFEGKDFTANTLIHSSADRTHTPIDLDEAAGSQEALEEDAKKTPLELLQENMPLAMKIAGDYDNIPGVDRDEVRQRARIALARAARAFDPARGSKFSALAGRAVENELKSLYRTEKTRASRFETTLDEPVAEGEDATRLDHTPDLRADVPGQVERDEARRVLNGAVDALPGKMKTAINGILAGKTLDEIGGELGGLTKQGVSRLASEAMRRLRGKLGEQGVKSPSDLLRSQSVDELEHAVNGLLKAQSTGDPIADLLSRLNTDDIGEFQRRAEGEKSGQRKIGRPDLSLGAEGPQIMGVDEYRKILSSEKESDWQAAAEKMIAGDNYEKTAKSLVSRALQSRGTLDPIETKAAQMIVAREMSQPLDAEGRKRVQALVWAYRQTGMETARALAARHDPFKTPEERSREFLAKVIFTPDKATRAEIDRAPTPEARQKLLDRDQERISKVEAELGRMGVSFDDILAREVDLKLQGAPVVMNIVSTFDQKRQQAFKLLQGGQTSFADVAKQTGLGEAELKKVKADFIEALRKKHFAKFQKGLKASDVEGTQGTLFSQAADGPAVSDAEAEAEFQKALRMMGIVPDEDQGKMQVVRRKRKKLFVPRPAPFTGRVPTDEPVGRIPDKQSDLLNPERNKARAPTDVFPVGRTEGTQTKMELPTGFDHDEWVQTMVRKGADAGSPDDVVKLARMIQAAGGKRSDMAYEAWIQGMLSGPHTGVAKLSGDAIHATWDLTVQRGMESMLNLFYKDADAAQLGEFKYIAKGFLPGLIKGIREGARAWNTEENWLRFDHSPDRQQMEIGGGAGDFGGEGQQRRGNIPGKAGRIIRMPTRFILFLDSFCQHAYGQMEAGAQAYRIAKKEGLEGDAMSGRINELVATPYSEAWQRAVDNAERVTYHEKIRNLDESAEAGSGDPISRHIDAAMAGFNKMVGGSHIWGIFFPFRKIPYNIVKTGLRKTPLGGLNMLAHFTEAGIYKIKDGKPMFESYSAAKQVKDLAEQVIAWTTASMIAGAVTGDEDDDKKKFLITGSMPFTETKRGERELMQRAYGGTYQMRIGGRNGVTVNYGRYEPIATVLGTVVDTVSQWKKHEHGMPASQTVDGVLDYFLAQAQEKTFLRGMADMTKTIQSSKGITDFAQRTLMEAIVPNLIRQPLRSLDDYVRDSKGAGPAYDMLPASGLAQPKLDMYGQEEKKSGNPISRLFFQTGTVPYPELSKADRLFMNWARENPDAEPGDSIPSSPSSRTLKFTDARGVKQTHAMNDVEWHDFTAMAGRFATRNLRQMGLSQHQINHPTPADLHAVREAIDKAHTEARGRMEERMKTPAKAALSS